MERYDWQQRTELLLGEEKMERIRNAHVLVVGLGGVGAYAAEMIYESSVAGHAFHAGEDESGSVGSPL